MSDGQSALAFNKKYAKDYVSIDYLIDEEETEEGNKPEILPVEARNNKAVTESKENVTIEEPKLNNNKTVGIAKKKVPVSEKEKRSRKYTDKNKARFGNHNRKKGAHKKQQRGMF